MNKVSVCNANDPMPTGQRDIGTILLSPFEDGHYDRKKIMNNKQQKQRLVYLFSKTLICSTSLVIVLQKRVWRLLENFEDHINTNYFMKKTVFWGDGVGLS